jgi:hypothetical protein
MSASSWRPLPSKGYSDSVPLHCGLGLASCGKPGEYGDRAGVTFETRSYKAQWLLSLSSLRGPGLHWVATPNISAYTYIPASTGVSSGPVSSGFHRLPGYPVTSVLMLLVRQLSCAQLHHSLCTFCSLGYLSFLIDL